MYFQQAELRQKEGVTQITKSKRRRAPEKSLELIKFLIVKIVKTDARRSA